MIVYMVTDPTRCDIQCTSPVFQYVLSYGSRQWNPSHDDGLDPVGIDPSQTVTDLESCHAEFDLGAVFVGIRNQEQECPRRSFGYPFPEVRGAFRGAYRDILGDEI